MAGQFLHLMTDLTTRMLGPRNPQEPVSLERYLDHAINDTSLTRQYDQNRQNLINLERDDSWDGPAKRNSSTNEIAAAKIVQRIRNDENINLFGNLPTEAVPGPDTRDMGGKYLVNLDRIEESKLLKIVKRMPKGANLHLHFNAGLDPQEFIKRARGMPTMFIRSTRQLVNDEDFTVAELVFCVLPVDTMCSNIFSSEYDPQNTASGSKPWMKWTDFCEQYNAIRVDDAESFVRGKMVPSAAETYDMNQTVNGIWARSNQATRCFKGLFNYESSYRWYISALLQNLIDDKIMYVELRPMLRDKWIPTDDGLGRLYHTDQMRMLLEEVSKKTAVCQSNSFPFGVKIIYCAPRSTPRADMQIELRDCIRLKLDFPQLICGFDLVGAEDRPNSIRHYRAELLAFRETCAKLKLDIPFLFHAGETLLDTGGTLDPENSNLYDAVLLKSKRIGHGNALLNHPELMRLIRESGTGIEVCPISNEILHLCGNAKEHCLPQLLANGLHCTIGSDNPSIFSSTLSHDFYQVLVGSTTMSLHGLRQLVEWSIEHSCLSSQEMKTAFDILKADWEEFCVWIISAYDQPHVN